MTRPVHIFLVLVLFLILSMVIIAGCTKSLNEKAKLKPDAESVHLLLTKQFSRIEAFKADATIKVKYGVMTATFWGEYQAAHPSEFHGKFRGPFGIFLAEITTDSLDYEVFLPKGQVETGAKESLDLNELIGFPLPVFEPSQLFFPVAVPPDSVKSIIGLEVDSTSIYWEITEKVDGNGFHREFTFDSKNRCITNEKWFNSDDDLFLEKTYSDIIINDNIPIPGSLHLKMYSDQGGEIVITFNDYEVNPGWKESPFQMRLKQGV